MTDLIIMIGVPGSGKSTLAGMIASNYRSQKSSVVILSSDAIRGELLGDESDQEHNDLVFKELRRRINNSIGKNNVIVDATNVTVKSRRTILDLVRNNPEVNKIAYVMTTPVFYCKKQNKGRPRVVPEYVIDRQIHSFEIPFYEEGFNEIILVGWNDGFYTRKKDELNQANEDYIPMLMEGFDQKTHHHKYTLDVHCKKCAEEIKKRTDDEILIRAAEIHDIGKLYTGKEKDDGSGEYCYYNHQNVGTYTLLQNLDFVGFTDYEKILKTLFYVNYHMLPFSLQSEKAVKKWEQIMGKENLDTLFMFNECDRIASGSVRNE